MTEPAPAAPVARTVQVMGTVASIQVHRAARPTDADRAIDACVAELRRLEAMFSTFRADSEISALNRGERTLETVSAEVIEVLDACTWLEHASGGAFDIRPDGAEGPIDPAGYVKGWTAERSADLLTAHGFDHWIVNVGGDLQTHGSPAGAEPWQIAIAHPVRVEAVVAVVEVHGAGAVATSGTAERGAHLRTMVPGGDPPMSVTVTGPSLARADALATTVFALGGVDGLGWLRGSPGYTGLAVWADGRVEYSAGLPGRILGVVGPEGPSALPSA